jgi:hypothetical protein
MGALNAASVYSAILTGAGAKNAQLTVGKTYRFVVSSADVRLGFGATAAAADTDAGSARGEYLSAPGVRQFTVTTAAVAFVSRTSVGADADVIIREVVGA